MTTRAESQVRFLVEGFYDIQKLRVETFNRIVAYVKANLEKFSHIKLKPKPQMRANTQMKPKINLRATENLKTVRRVRAIQNLKPMEGMRAKEGLKPIYYVRAVVTLKTIVEVRLSLHSSPTKSSPANVKYQRR